MGANGQLFELVFQFAHRSSFFDALGIFLADWILYLLVALVLILGYLEKNWRLRTLFLIETALVSILSRGVVAEIIYAVYRQPRPPEVLEIEPLLSVGGAAFPSGHATILFGIATVTFMFYRKWGFWFLGLATMSSLARIFVGVHWPADILGGALLGIGSGLIVYLLLSDSAYKIRAASKS